MNTDWWTFYYVNPRPERFVEEVKLAAAAGVLADARRSLPFITFLSRVIAANPARVGAWAAALAELSGADRRSFERALWWANSAEASAALGERARAPEFAEPVPDLLTVEISGPEVLDALWGYYFATGEPRAVRRIISVFEHMSAAAQPGRAAAQIIDDKARAQRELLFQVASSSLASLLREHQQLKRYCGELVRGAELRASERAALAMILSREDPSSWRIKIDPLTSSVSISWNEATAAPVAHKRRPWWKLW